MSSVRISAAEVDFHPTSFSDAHGRLFVWDGQPYRGLTDKGADLYRRLIAQGILPPLMAKGLFVDTDLTQLTLDGYPLVLKHRRVPFVSYAYEWCGPMLKDAALLVIDLELELAQQGWTLEDPNPWNVLFDGCRPVYVDFGSLVPARADDEAWDGYGHFFRRHFLWPLLLRAHGHESLARGLSYNFDHGIIEADLRALIGRWPVAPGYRHRIHHATGAVTRAIFRQWHRIVANGLGEQALDGDEPEPVMQPSRRRFLQHVRDVVQRVTFPSQPNPAAEASNYAYPSSTPASGQTRKRQVVHHLLSELRPTSVLDLGSGGGEFAWIAARRGANVIALDQDESQVAQCYDETRRQNLSILPLVLDARYPSPGQGVCNAEFPPATERLQCDLVLALSVIHMLVFQRALRFDQLCRTLAAFAKRWLVVEFVAPQDSFIRLRRQRSEYQFPWYTLDNFIAALHDEFYDVKIVGSDDEDNILVLCTKSG